MKIILLYLVDYEQYCTLLILFYYNGLEKSSEKNSLFFIVFAFSLLMAILHLFPDLMISKICDKHLNLIIYSFTINIRKQTWFIIIKITQEKPFSYGFLIYFIHSLNITSKIIKAFDLIIDNIYLIFFRYLNYPQ